MCVCVCSIRTKILWIVGEKLPEGEKARMVIIHTRTCSVIFHLGHRNLTWTPKRNNLHDTHYHCFRGMFVFPRFRHQYHRPVRRSLRAMVVLAPMLAHVGFLAVDFAPQLMRHRLVLHADKNRWRDAGASCQTLAPDHDADGRETG